ncbi:hypothetical protein [Sphingomonas sp. GM_Shp_1]|uniref:hypothetical protein n=1 Tax=Sphingomonas sp. GM_Shp_1 TaxID=2937381 RepID=UPI00226B3425|nr:hypothetical protein [Sphingomonas sp. GM_Shp_1]
MWYAVYGFWLFVVLTSLAAWRWGSRIERGVAGLYLAAALATVALRLPGSSDYATVNAGVFLIDLTLLMGLVWTALKHARWWLIASAALQLVTVLGHIAMFDAQRTAPFAYFAAVVGTSYPSQILLAYAIARRGMRATRKPAPRYTPSQSQNA